MNKDELLERYEALGEEGDFLAAKRLFERDLTEQSSAQERRQYGYLLECHGRYAIGRAVEQYERSMALDPGADKVRYQWMSAKAALGQPEDAVALYRERVADSPGDVRELRFLSTAYLMARDFRAVSEVIDAGLELAPDDWKLFYDRGEVKAARGDPEGALADWRRALELYPEDLSPVYASAFLLEREGRLAEAAESWRHIMEHAEARGWELTAAWPRRELQRLRERLAERQDPGP
jgi:tetratricopeptide (TPR) repeat protein